MQDPDGLQARYAGPNGAHVIHETRVHIPHDVEGGSLDNKQWCALHPFVHDKHVHDLGAGDLILTGILLAMGARHVTAIDKGLGTVGLNGQHITGVRSWFHQYKPTSPIEVAFVSWPPYQVLWPPAPEYIAGLVNLCAQAPIVAYLGSNFGSVCGNREFWLHVGTREVLQHVPDPRNTLIVYGRQGRRAPGQGMLPEEAAALYREVTPLPVYGVTYG